MSLPGQHLLQVRCPFCYSNSQRKKEHISKTSEKYNNKKQLITIAWTTTTEYITLINTHSNRWAILHKLQQLRFGRSRVSKQQNVDVPTARQTVWKPNRQTNITLQRQPFKCNLQMLKYTTAALSWSFLLRVLYKYPKGDFTAWMPFNR